MLGHPRLPTVGDQMRRDFCCLESPNQHVDTLGANRNLQLFIFATSNGLSTAWYAEVQLPG